MHTNICKSLHECSDRKLENVLTDHIIVSSVGGRDSTRMQPTDPTDLAAKCGIGLGAARCTLECTTQRGFCTVIHPYLSLSFQINDQQLRYKRLQHDVFGDTLIARTKSERCNKYAEVFVTKFGWSGAFSMAKKVDTHEALSLLFQRDEVPPKI